MTPRHFFGEICEQRYADQQICRAVASATRVNQGVGPWVLQQPLTNGPADKAPGCDLPT
jgi:hypothetical protein